MHFVGYPYGLSITISDILARLKTQNGKIFGELLVITKRENGVAIGECWLGKDSKEKILEPDVKLFPEYWGNKFGIEVWRGLVEYIFSHSQCQIIQGTPNIGNIASIRMQESVGATRISQGKYYFSDTNKENTTPINYYLYQLTKQQYSCKLVHE